MSGRWYAFWSGFGADIGEFTIFVFIWRKFTCDVAGCHRLAFNRVHGTHFTTCRKHHPDGPSRISAQDIADHQKGTVL